MFSHYLYRTVKKMKNNNLWEKLKNSGKVEDYLNYKKNNDQEK